MFEFIKNKILTPRQPLFTTVDLHSHLIPEIDDGTESLDISLKLIKQMRKLGYKKLITTPHIMSHRYPNSIKIIKEGLFELRSVLKVKNIDIEIEAAAEYYFDEHFIDLINKKEILSFGDKYVLFELPYTTRPKLLEPIIMKMNNLGYKPVLAHPERYRFLTEIVEYRKLKKLGLFFQININSLGGFYGEGAQKKSLMLAQKGMIDFIGSDLHHQKHMDHFKKNIQSNHIEMVFRNNKILNDTI